MHEEVTEFLLRLRHPEQGTLGAADDALIADLSARLAIERRLVEHDFGLIALGQRSDFFAGLEDAADFAFRRFRLVAEELRRADTVLDLEPMRFGGGIARTLPGPSRLFLLTLHRGVEASEIDADAARLQSILGQIEREAEGVVELERDIAGEHVAAAQIVGGVIEQDEAALKGAPEPCFLELQRFRDQALRCNELGVGIAHLAHQCRHETIHQRFLGAEQMRVPHGTPHDAAQHVTATLVERQHAVRDQETRRSQMVGDDAMARLVLTRSRNAGRIDRSRNQCLEEVGVVVGRDALQQARDALEPHAGVDRRFGERDPVTGAALLILHEDEVVEFEEAIAILVGAAGRAAFEFVALVEEQFRAGAAGAGVAHRPEVIRCFDADDLAVGEARDLLPERGRVLVLVVDGDQQALLVEAVVLGDKSPGHLDRLRLEIVAEREIAEHFEERVMACGISDVVEVVVLATGADALLSGHCALVAARFLAREDVLELHHAGGREHQRRIIARHQR